eukprot:scaffold43634_cov64-Phaeocystis_antarctica.AAC.6
MDGSAPAPRPSASRCTPSTGLAASECSTRRSSSSAGSTEPSVPSNARSAAVRPPPCGTTLQPPRDQSSAAATAPASPSVARCWRCSKLRRRAARARCTAGRRRCPPRHRSASTAPSPRAPPGFTPRPHRRRGHDYGGARSGDKHTADWLKTRMA